MGRGGGPRRRVARRARPGPALPRGAGVLELAARREHGVAVDVVAGRIKQMVELLADGQTAEAATIHLELLPLVEALFWQPNPMPVRAALNELGFNVGMPRLPLIDLTEAEKDRLRAVLAKYEFDAYLSKQPLVAKV